MVICFIIPSSGFLIDDRVFPFLGVLYVARAMRDAGWEVKVCDLSGNRDCVQIPEADLYGITSTTAQFPEAVRIARILRSNTNTPVVLGGPHATLTAASAKKGSERGMMSLFQIFKEFGAVVLGDDPSGLLNMIRNGSSLWDGDQRDSLLPASNLFPARELIDLTSYQFHIDGRAATSVISQLGCPFGCRFCAGRSSYSFRKSRRRDPDNVAMEIYYLHRTYGYCAFMFYDDEINVGDSAFGLVSSLRDLKDDGHDFWYRGFVRARGFTEEMAKQLSEVGFKWLLSGFESADPYVLSHINKGCTIDDNMRMIEYCKKYGIKVKALMSIGHPGDTEDTAYKIEEFLLGVEVDDFDVSIITPYPGSPYYDEARNIGTCYEYRCGTESLFLDDVDFSLQTAFYKGRPGEYESFVWTDALERESIPKIRDEIERNVRRKLYGQEARAESLV